MSDADDGRDDRLGGQPDPDADRWSAWLPELDASRPHLPHSDQQEPDQQEPDRHPPPSATADPTHPGAGSPTSPLPQASRPLPQASRPLPRPSRPKPHQPPAPYPWTPQPFAYASTPSSRAVRSSHLVLAVVALFVFPIPFGIVAVLFAVASLGHRATGRTGRAESASRSARNWSIAAFAAIPLMFLVAGGLFAFAR